MNIFIATSYKIGVGLFHGHFCVRHERPIKDIISHFVRSEQLDKESLQFQLRGINLTRDISTSTRVKDIDGLEEESRIYSFKTNEPPLISANPVRFSIVYQWSGLKRYSKSANEYVSTIANNFNFKLGNHLVHNGRNLPPRLTYQYRDRIVYQCGEPLLFEKYCPIKDIPSFGEGGIIYVFETLD